MSERELLVVSLLFQYHHTQPYASANLRQIYEYGVLYVKAKQRKDLTLSDATLRRALPKLVDLGYLAEGTRHGQKKTYYITLEGIAMLSNRAELKQKSREILSQQKEMCKKQSTQSVVATLTKK